MCFGAAAAAATTSTTTATNATTAAAATTTATTAATASTAATTNTITTSHDAQSLKHDSAFLQAIKSILSLSEQQFLVRACCEDVRLL